jgi:hypothetical protein
MSLSAVQADADAYAVHGFLGHGVAVRALLSHRAGAYF